jgi:[FeFe] hydrogenase H-cluster maturation GTPase HydF
MNLNTPKGMRPHIAVFGRRNAGKSSFINAFLGQEMSIVSALPGTTTDPVEKAYELQPFGPVLLIDTAGIDDVGELGKKRIKKTVEVLKRTDLAVLILENNLFGEPEEQLIFELKKRKVPFLVVVNKIDLASDQAVLDFAAKVEKLIKLPVLRASALNNTGLDKVKDAAIKLLDHAGPMSPLLADLVKPGDWVVLVIPIDKEAPQGRIILPQVNAIRELLDYGIPSIVTRETELAEVLQKNVKKPPRLVVTDSQAFKLVNNIVPKKILLTGFSVLLARQRGDLKEYVKGTKAIKKLKDGDTILIAELCSHRPIGEDIGRIKIPRWLEEYTGKKLKIEVSAGKDYPEDLTKYALVIQCGGCVVNRRLIMSRINQAKEQKVPITNYGICIAYLTGVLDRSIAVFK